MAWNEGEHAALSNEALFAGFARALQTALPATLKRTRALLAEGRSG